VITLAFNALDVSSLMKMLILTISRNEIALKWIYLNSFTICSFGGSHRGIEVARACGTSDTNKDRVNVFLGLFAHFIDNRPWQIFRNLSSCIS
jgi:hypothetical protein